MSSKFHVCRSDDSEQEFSSYYDAFTYATANAENKESTHSVWTDSDSDDQSVALVYESFKDCDDNALAIIFVM